MDQGGFQLFGSTVFNSSTSKMYLYEAFTMISERKVIEENLSEIASIHTQ